MKRSLSIPRTEIAQFASSFGPAWLVMIADVDAASVITAAETGAVFHYGLIWLLLLLTVPLFFIQEASGRIGVVTRKGLGEIIRENYSGRVALLAVVPMALTDILTYVAEYLGIAIGLELLGVNPVGAVLLAFVLHVLFVYRRKYSAAEKVMLAISAIMLFSYVGSLALRGSMNFSPFYFSTNPAFLFLVAANAGAVVMPFMPFYQASATAEKKAGNVWCSRMETLVGAIVSEVLMVIIVMVSSGFDSTMNFTSTRELSSGLSAVAGQYAPILFGIGLTAAAFLALMVISFGSAWGLVEALGWSRSRTFPVYLLESIPAVLLTLILTTNLLNAILSLMFAFVFVLIGPALIMGLIASNDRVMGEYASRGLWKTAYWMSLTFVVGLGIVSIISLL
jgi:Mn2+/Fe2+ NRAMP family transporter